MDFNTVNIFSVVIATLTFASFAAATTFMGLSLFYAVYKERKLRVPSAIPVLNLSAAGMLTVNISGLFVLLFEVIHIQAPFDSFRLIKSFFHEFLLGAYFQALFFICLNRYGFVLCKGISQRVSVKQTTTCIGFQWSTAALYGLLVSFYMGQHQERYAADAYPRGVAAAQFTFLGFTQFGTIFVYANLALHFYLKQDKLPTDFYSRDSSTRRIAERNIRVSVKNIQMIALTVGALCACHFPYLGCVTTAMFTGQLSRNIEISATVLIHCGIVLNLVIYGYCNKRFKRVLRPMLHRIFSRIAWRNRRKLHELLPRNKLFLSKFSIHTLERSEYELTRCNLELVHEVASR